jgi:hypothetical protein
MTTVMEQYDEVRVSTYTGAPMTLTDAVMYENGMIRGINTNKEKVWIKTWNFFVVIR